VPIPGTTKLPRLEENLLSLEVTWSPRELREVGQVLDVVQVQGDRYPARLAALVGK
jgi:aryl-alcohol dehydrogenase-like predicted oxidoreductase